MKIVRVCEYIILEILIVAMVPLKDNIALKCVLFSSELIYSIEQCNYITLPTRGVLHSMFDVYRVYT